jgi:predicted transcriptional regulator of viral defense system
MTFREFESKYRDYPIIKSSFLELEKGNVAYMRRLISEWKKKKWLIELKKGTYVINKPYFKDRLDVNFIANSLYFPSYISLESALSLYNMIPEGVFVVTSVSTKKTNRFKNEFGEFSYSSVKPSLFFGFEKISGIFFATREKALLDFLYFNLPKLDPNMDLIGNYRLQNLDKLNKTVFKEYLKRFNSKKLTALAEKLLKDRVKYNVI